MREGGKIFFFQLILSKRGKFFLFLGFLIFGSFFHQNAQAATSYFSPSSGNFSVGNIFTVNILVNTEGVAINNPEAVINFPVGLLELKRKVRRRWFFLLRRFGPMTVMVPMC